jgi:glycine oxidase
MATVVVVGGGVVGCAVAERLSRERRHRVVLLERDAVGSHASGAAAGLLAPYSEHLGDGTPGRDSLALYPELVARVERCGIAVEFRAQETLAPALSAEEERLLGQSSATWLDAAEARHREPEVSPSIRGAALHEEAQVTPIRLVHALARTAVRQGAEIKEGVPVSGLSVHSGLVDSVQVPDGSVQADWVVLAAGPWSPGLASPAGVTLDVRPSRGQLVTLRPVRGCLSRVIVWRGCYLVPKPDGTIVAGSTEEDVGFDPRPTAEGIAGLLQFAARAVPILSSATVERVWAALRPATPDGRPVVGPAPGLPNLILATGHNRNGILLAPLTAELVARVIP